MTALFPPLFCGIMLTMDLSILPPTDDWIFKLLFGNERNKSMLIDLLGSFVELPQEEYELTFLDTHLKPENEDDKLGILDVKVRTAAGKIIDIEIQVNPVKNIGKRLSFYKSKLIVEQVGKGLQYKVIQRVICICITNYELFRGVREYVNNFRFWNKENGLCFEEIPEEVYTVELPKVPEASDGSAGWGWLQFLRSRRKEEFEMVAERNPEIRKAVETLYELSADEEVRAEYEMRQKAWRDRISEIDGAREDGMERGMGIGMERGRNNRNEEIVKNALAKGYSMELINDITGLDIKTIQSFKKMKNEKLKMKSDE